MFTVLLQLVLGLKAVMGTPGLAITPQMGWNTWNKFACNISEETILGAAKALKSNGLDKFGYEYVVIDDCWHAPARDNTTGAPVADPVKFPNGIQKLAQEVHDLGLKIGIYSDAGKFTCGGRFGSLGFESIDAQTYASWGVDYLKYDNCFNEGQSGTPLISYTRYLNMSQALAATGRPILLSVCNWGEDQPWNWARTIANSWRISGDIFDTFDRFDDRCPCTSMVDCKLPGFHCAMSRIIDFAAPLGQKAGPGGWNDLDMLEIGNGGMTKDEYITHFSMWSVLKSPLILGNDVENMTNDTLEIITNDAIIAVSQDPLGSPGVRVSKTTLSGGGDISVWIGSLVNNSVAVAIMNTSPESQNVNVTFKNLFVDNRDAALLSYRVFDLWDKGSNETSAFTNSSTWGSDMGVFKTALPNVTVASHLTKVLKMVPVDGPTTAKRDIGDL